MESEALKPNYNNADDKLIRAACHAKRYAANMTNKSHLEHHIFLVKKISRSKILNTLGDALQTLTAVGARVFVYDMPAMSTKETVALIQKYGDELRGVPAHKLLGTPRIKTLNFIIGGYLKLIIELNLLNLGISNLKEIKKTVEAYSELIIESKIGGLEIADALVKDRHQNTEECKVCGDAIGLGRIIQDDQDSSWSRVLEEEEPIRKKRPTDTSNYSTISTNRYSYNRGDNDVKQKKLRKIKKKLGPEYESNKKEIKRMITNEELIKISSRSAMEIMDCMDIKNCPEEDFRIQIGMDDRKLSHNAKPNYQ